jgi:2',3'-cyclic-nucleotide 2'-phosphodiesterase / 3'-nucleotidase
VLSIAAPFNRSASFPAGDVSRRDVAGLYIYDNFLFAVKVTGQQVIDYLEYSMRYFKQVPGPGTYSMADVTNASYGVAGSPGYVPPIPDYNFDTIAGLDAHLTYDVDLAQPAGSRIVDLKYGDNPVSTTAEFALAVNNYRQSGGGGFPAVKTAPVLYSNSTDIRQLLIDWVGTHHVIDPTQFASVDWRLVANGEALTIT